MFIPIIRRICHFDFTLYTFLGCLFVLKTEVRIWEAM
jgi:hypothetical protein